MVNQRFVLINSTVQTFNHGRRFMEIDSTEIRKNIKKKKFFNELKLREDFDHTQCLS